MTTYFQPLKTSPKQSGERKAVEVKHVNSNSYKARQYARYAAFRDIKLEAEEIAKASSVKEKKVRPVLSLRVKRDCASLDNRCLNDVAIYSTTKHREQPKTEFGITARA